MKCLIPVYKSIKIYVTFISVLTAGCLLVGPTINGLGPRKICAKRKNCRVKCYVLHMTGQAIKSVHTLPEQNVVPELNLSAISVPFLTLAQSQLLTYLPNCFLADFFLPTLHTLNSNLSATRVQIRGHKKAKRVACFPQVIASVPHYFDSALYLNQRKLTWLFILRSSSSTGHSKMPFSDAFRKVSIKQGTLTAECRKADNKTWISSSLNLDDFLGNVDGKFVLGGKGFSRSAQDITLADAIITAKLKNGAGKFVDAKFDLSQYVSSQDGILAAYGA